MIKMTWDDALLNARRISVQIGSAGGAMVAAVGSFQAFAEQYHLKVTVPAGLYILAGVMIAVGVFFGRVIPQPNLNPQEQPK